MGFFSWITQDTERSICNKYSTKATFTVYLLDDKGNFWEESDYDGYGVFGGKDYYELLAEMNGITSDKTGEEYTEEMRSKGIKLAFENTPNGYNENIKHPNLVEDKDRWNYSFAFPLSCDEQGFFYNETEDDEDY